MVMLTAVAGAPWSLTWIVQVAVLPRATLSWPAWTLTHSCGAAEVGAGDAVGVADGDVVTPAGGVLHWEVMIVAAVTAAAGGVCIRKTVPCRPLVRCQPAYSATRAAPVRTRL